VEAGERQRGGGAVLPAVDLRVQVAEDLGDRLDALEIRAGDRDCF